jgi:hypothetical protein
MSNIPHKIEINPFTQLTRVTVSISDKINKKRLNPNLEYEAIDVFASVSLDIMDMADISNIIKKAYECLENEVESEVAKLAEKISNQTVSASKNLYQRPKSPFTKRGE